jgi:putative ABC transport system permease protein
MRLLPFDYAARNAGRKKLTTVLTSGGAAVVVLLVMVMGAFVETLASTMRSTGDARNVIVLGTGSEDFLEQSEIPFNTPSLLSATILGISKHNGTPVISPEIHHAAVVRDARNDPESKVLFGLTRGVTPAALLVHQQVFLSSGRFPGPGEVLVGKLAPRKLGLSPEASQIGQQIWFENQPWTISGTFEAPGTAFEAELWVPIEDLKIATKRTTMSCAIAQMEQPSGMVAVNIFCKSRPDLEISVVRESEYYAGLAAFFKPLQVVGWIMAVLITIAGLFGGLNAMMAAVSARAREIACLETLGFSRFAITTSLLQETLLQVGTGSLVAAGIALFVVAGTTARFVMGAISINVQPHVLLIGFGAGLLLAVGGAVFPAVRLFRKPLVEVLRS